MCVTPPKWKNLRPQMHYFWQIRMRLIYNSITDNPEKDAWRAVGGAGWRVHPIQVPQSDSPSRPTKSSMVGYLTDYLSRKHKTLSCPPICFRKWLYSPKTHLNCLHDMLEIRGVPQRWMRGVPQRRLIDAVLHPQPQTVFRTWMRNSCTTTIPV